MQCDSEGSTIARFVRLSMKALMAREVLMQFSWSGTSRVNKQGIIQPKESFMALKGFCSTIQSTHFVYSFDRKLPYALLFARPVKSSTYGYEFLQEALTRIW